MHIARLYLSAGHNYVGHHGKAPGESPVCEVDTIECVAGQGIRGDRFFGHKVDYKGQITFFDIEVHRALCERFGVDPAEKSPALYRRNVLTSDIDLNTLIGVDFEVQGVRFHGVEECSPCYWMDHAFGSGAEDALRGSGGLRARILSDGELRVDAGIAADALASPPAPTSPLSPT